MRHSGSDAHISETILVCVGVSVKGCRPLFAAAYKSDIDKYSEMRRGSVCVCEGGVLLFHTLHELINSAHTALITMPTSARPPRAQFGAGRRAQEATLVNPSNSMPPEILAQYEATIKPPSILRPSPA